MARLDCLSGRHPLSDWFWSGHLPAALSPRVATHSMPRRRSQLLERTRQLRSTPQASIFFSACLLHLQTSSPLKKSRHVPTWAPAAANLRAWSAHGDWQGNSVRQTRALFLCAQAEATVEAKSTSAASVVAEAGVRLQIPLAAPRAARS